LSIVQLEELYTHITLFITISPDIFFIPSIKILSYYNKECTRTRFFLKKLKPETLI